MRTFDPALIMGCGDIGLRIARLELAAGREVYALTRNSKTSRACHNALPDMEARVIDLDSQQNVNDLSDALPAGVHLYYLAPPAENVSSPRTDPRIRTALSQEVLARLRPRRIVYISTTGVYGDHQGAPVDERTPATPQNDRSWRRLDAERYLDESAKDRDFELVILRVAGIYGPGRLPADRLKNGMPVLRESESPYTNRIHADDLAQVCLAAMHRAPTHQIYNVSDGNPGTMTEYYREVARQLRLPIPEEISMAVAKQRFSPMMMSFLTESKQINNAKMLRDLGVELTYPDIRAGILASISLGE